METVEDPYFLAHKELAVIIQNKIMKDYLFLLEELRQDIPLMETVAHRHPKRIKYSDEEVAKAVTILIPNNLFADFVLAHSYQNSNPQKALTLFLEIQQGFSPESKNELQSALSGIINAYVSKLEVIVNKQEDLTANSSNQGLFSFFPQVPVDEKQGVAQLNDLTIAAEVDSGITDVQGSGNSTLAF